MMTGNSTEIADIKKGLTAMKASQDTSWVDCKTRYNAARDVVELVIPVLDTVIASLPRELVGRAHKLFEENPPLFSGSKDD